jgi:mycothiol synthase
VDDLRFRAPTPADAEALARLAAAAEEVDRTGEHYSSEDMAEELANPLIDRERDWVLAELDGRLVGCALLNPRAPTDDRLSVVLEGIVHPAHRGRGIGSALLERMLGRAPQHVHERGAHLELQLRAGAASDNEGATSLLEDHGFVAHRWNFVMEADLHRAAPGRAPDLPAGYVLETWVGTDDHEIRAAHNCAFMGFHPGFSPWDEALWTQWVSGSRVHRPSLSLLARDAAGSIAAYLQTAEFEAVQETTGLREAFVAKVGTTPDHRRRGLAGVLLGHALVRYREDGFDRAALDVDSENPSGALSIYERAGFEVTKRYTLYTLP